MSDGRLLYRPVRRRRRLQPDGQLVAVAYQYDDAAGPVPAVTLWDARTGAEVARLLGPARDTQSLAFSPDGRLLAGASVHEGTPDRVTVWDVASATERYSFEPAAGAGPLAFRADPPSIVVAGTDEAVGFYSVDDGRALDSLPTPGLAVIDGLALDPTGDLLALASQESKATQLWDLRSRSTSGRPTARPGPSVGALAATSSRSRGSTRAPFGSSTPARVRNAWCCAGTGAARGMSPSRRVGSWRASPTVSGLRMWDVTDDGPRAAPSRRRAGRTHQLGAVLPRRHRDGRLHPRRDHGTDRDRVR